MKIKVFVLTIDSESWLGSEIHTSYEEAYNSLLEDCHWIAGMDSVDTSDEDEVRGLTGDDGVFWCIEEKIIDTDRFKSS